MSDAVRLPPGQSIQIIGNRGDMEFTMANHPFIIQFGDRTYLSDMQTGEEWVLNPGRNVIGRKATGTATQQPQPQRGMILVDPAHKGVSRKHMVIDRIDNSHLVFTDTNSSYGTFVPRGHIAKMESAITRRAGMGGSVHISESTEDDDEISRILQLSGMKD